MRSIIYTENKSFITFITFTNVLRLCINVLKWQWPPQEHWSWHSRQISPLEKLRHSVKMLYSSTKTTEGGGEYKKLWDCWRVVIVGLVASCKRCRAAGEKWQKCKRECCGPVILDLEWSRRRCRRWLWCLQGGIVAAWSLVPRLVQEAASGEEWGKQAGARKVRTEDAFST